MYEKVYDKMLMMVNNRFFLTTVFKYFLSYLSPIQHTYPAYSLLPALWFVIFIVLSQIITDYLPAYFLSFSLHHKIILVSFIFLYLT